VIEARQLTKRFGGHAAIEDVSLAVTRGQVTGFLGPNGAGKTTTMRVLAGVFPPTSGQALIDGADVVGAPLAARRRLGYAPERPALHLEMTVGGLLDFTATMKDIGGRGARRTACGTALERAGLRGFDTQRVGALSRGYRQRLGLALALLGDPPALILDEPTVGLDPEQRAETRRLIRDLGAAGHAVLVSSHALAEVEGMCDQVIILHRGHVLAAEPPARLAARLRPCSRVDIEAAAPAAALASLLAETPGVRRVDPIAIENEHAGNGAHARYRVELEPRRDVRAELAARITARGWDLLTLAPVEASLEEAFLALVSANEPRPDARTD
jgi:ABC-2 type transport system ATP-binding protein